MARRKTEDEDGGMDSLLDTMFNVVGILLIVLVVVQLGVRQAVDRIASTVAVDPAALEAMIKKLEEAHKEKLKVQTSIDELNPDESKLEELLKRLRTESVAKEATLVGKEGDLKKAIVAKKAQDEMAMKAGENKQAREKLSTELNSSLEKIASLEAVLADSKPRSQLPPKIVNMPDPRPAPDGIKEAIFICIGNQVYPYNPGELREDAKKRSEYQLQRGLKKYVKDPEQGVDAKDFVEDFNQRVLQDDYFKAEMYASGRNPNLRLTPREGQGFTIAEVENPRSRFQKLLLLTDPQKYYFKFIVLPDSYEAYVAVRAVADKAGYLAGWEPQSQEWKAVTGVGGKVKFGPEPKVDPNAPKPAPATPAPKANVLD
ncbi:hypothetical protein LOC68_25070 [Blastopirellula sp. JC732]|uniref:Uncharacterized protein n=1 Tax=Blastopirellula sediminis TaxID=2894196 RepID=A0A9X1MSG9_9BACT|nr:hypothetical protein [Blastopirellula sediminis]MCC9605018.1 hypothetical protein [Blastopirellula sediminis]MCC9631682.1 hypothetical protein [Blastopirellula sediminis]